MLSLLSTAAMGSLCVDDTHCAQGEFCRIDLPVIARACVERPQYEVYDRCSSDLGHCCPKGTTCSGWFSKRCRPVVGECVKRPEICCQAFPSCKEGFEIDNEEVCKAADFETGRCKKESLCCSTITCVKKEEEKKSCTLPCGTVVPHGWGGKGEGNDWCNSCGCQDGNVICTEKFCGPEQCPCNEFTKESFCIAQEGVCYNAGKCSCGFFLKAQCLVEPCSVKSCPKGYTCRNNYCGGCHHQCVKEE